MDNRMVDKVFNFVEDWFIWLITMGIISSIFLLYIGAMLVLMPEILLLCILVWLLFRD